MKQPTNYTCFPTCVSYLTGIPLDELLDELGHMGELRESGYGYTFSEMSFLLLKKGWASIPIYPKLNSVDVNCPSIQDVLDFIYKQEKVIITKRVDPDSTSDKSEDFHCLAYKPKENIIMDPWTGKYLTQKQIRETKVHYYTILKKI